MQIQRLFEILYYLLQHSKVTSQQLADVFDVSVRTIYRDLDTLLLAGIPIQTIKGRLGGISLNERFILDKRILNPQEQEVLLNSLVSYQASGQINEQLTLEKLKSFFASGEVRDWIAIDYTDWSDHSAEKFSMIKAAITMLQNVQFDYYNAKLEYSRRTVQPLQLWFKSRTWYLKAYCLEKESLRLFKLSRMNHLELIEAHHRVDTSTMELENLMFSNVELITFKVRIDQSLAYRVYDEFNPDRIEKDPQGNFIVTHSIPYDNWIIGYLLSFGSSLEVLETQDLKEMIAEEIVKMTKRCQV